MAPEIEDYRSPWQRLLADVAEAKRELRCEHNGAWYRGVSKRSHKLLPTLLRDPRPKETEREIYNEYQRSTLAASIAHSTNSWFHLVDMQHFDRATRLMDWTRCFAVALYFALLKPFDPKDPPTLWVLNPFSLACRARGNNDRSLGDFHNDPDSAYYKVFIQSKCTWPYRLPFPFYSPAPNERIRAQRGFFTIHGTSDKPLENTCSKHVAAVTLREEVLLDAEQFLRLAGIDHDFLFPDQAGWSHKVQKDYFY